MNNKLRKINIPIFKNAYIFDEYLNKFGTIKDRRNERIIEEALKLHVDKLVLITSGNNGYSLAKMAENTSIKVVCVVSRRLDEKIKKLLEDVSYHVIELNLDQKILRPEELITIARETEEEVIWDVTNGYEDAYIPIIQDILEDFVPDYIICPLGSGGIYIGLIEGIEKYSPKTKVLGVGTQSPYQSLADKLSTPWTPYARAIENKNDLGHKIFRLTEDEIKKTFYKYQNIMPSEVSSVIVFAILDLFPFKPNDKIVFLNSGKMKL